MIIADQAKFIAAALQEWATTNGAHVHVAGDVVHLIDILRGAPGAPKAGILLVSEDPRGEHDELGRVDRVWKVVVARGRGFRLDTGESLTDGVAGGAPMFTLAEQAREILRSLRFDPRSTEVKAAYRGMRLFEVQGVIMDAYELTFSIGTQIPQQLE